MPLREKFEATIERMLAVARGCVAATPEGPRIVAVGIVAAIERVAKEGG